EQIFSYNISNPRSIARYYDFIWGADIDQVADFRAGNPNILLSYYIPFNRDNGTFDNSDLGKQHNLTYWKNVHPDWILYQCDRTTPAYEDNDPNMPLVFSNPAVVNWQFQTYALPAMAAGYDAIAADNVNLQNFYGACGYYQNGKWVQRYTGQPGDPQWQTDITQWAIRMQAALHSLQRPLALIPNLSLGSISPTAPVVQQFISHVDGVLDEGGFTNYANGYVTGAQWVQKINFIRNVQQQTEPYYIINQYPSAPLSRAQIQWALSSYLMAKGSLSTVFISGNQQYGVDLRYPEYSIAIGTPQGNMYGSQQVYWRKYSNGLVIVNPSASTHYTVTLDKSYLDAYGNRVSKTLTLQPHSGIILLNG
ncbi:MAG TPA: putative glycoside hydrolase, partial [Ktedonobacteraceae bacterium]